MSFVQVWFTGYYNPVKMIEELRFTGRRSEFDKILNITGMATIVVGAFLLLWD
jgi:hypothetical protein